MADFEEQIYACVVRKKTLNTGNLQIKRNTAAPLLLCDIVGAKTTDGEFFSVLNEKLKFRLCLLSGRITGFICANKRCKVYLLDDGTACIELSVFKERNAKINHWRRARYYHKPEFVGPFLDILKSAERLLDTANIIIGTALVVLGRIALYHGKICIIGFSLFAHKGANRDMEIAFKGYLVKCYRDKDSI